MEKSKKLYQDIQRKKKRGVLAPVKLEKSSRKDPRRKLTTWHPEDEQGFEIHPRNKTKWAPKRSRRGGGGQQRGERSSSSSSSSNNNNNIRGAGPNTEHGYGEHMAHTKTRTINIFSSTARSVYWLEADAVLRRKYEEFSNASASLHAAKSLLQMEESDMSEAAQAAKEEAGDGYRPYIPEKWIEEELKQRRSLSAGKPTGKLSAHYNHMQACLQVWKQLNLLYTMIADPKFASKNMRIAASCNDALRARLHQQGAALAFTNLAPLHWVSKDHFLCLLFAYYKFSPFQAHARIGAVYDTSLAERPYVERMLFRESFSMTDSKAMHTYEHSRERQKELMRLGTEVVNAVTSDPLPQFIGSPMKGTRASGSPSVVRARRGGGMHGSASMLAHGFPGARPILDDSLKVNDRREQNTTNVFAGAQIDALRLEYPSRVDRRVIVARIRILEQPMATRANLKYCMELWEWEVTGGCRLRDFVQIIALPAVMESECKLAVAVREAMQQREQDVIMFRNAQEEKRRKEQERTIFSSKQQDQSEEEMLQVALQNASAAASSAPQQSPASSTNSDINFLDRVHPFHFYLEFLTENPIIVEEFRQQCINRLTDDNRARALNSECELTLERWHTKNDTMRRKKAMYYLVHRTSDKCLQKWRRYTMNQRKIRECVQYAEKWYAKTYRVRAVHRWHKWVSYHQQEVKELKWAMDAYAQLTFKQMFRRWKSTTILEKKLRSMQEERVRVEYEHAMKNLVRLMDRTILRKVKASTFYSFSRWKQVCMEEIVFEKSFLWWRSMLARKAFNRLRDDAWEKINARYQDELDKNERQEEMMEAAREGERLAEAERQRILAERAAEAARLKAIEDEKQAYEDRMFAQRAAAVRQQEQITIRAYQREERLKQVKKEMNAMEAKMNGKWDSVEAGMCDKARFVAQELFETPKGKTKLLGIVYDMIEEIAATIKTREERMQCITNNTIETPRKGRPDWRVMYNEREASRYWHNKVTGEDVYPEFLTEYTKASKKKGKEMGMNLYADRKVVEARELSLRLRLKAWDKEVRVYNAKRLSRWWRRILCRKEVIEEQWRADLQRFRVKKAKFHPASKIIQAAARMWLAHPWLVYLVEDLQQIKRYDDKNGGAPYWASLQTGESSWEPPTFLSKRLESRLAARKLLKEERVYRMGKKRRENQRKMAMIAAGLISTAKGNL